MNLKRWNPHNKGDSENEPSWFAEQS